MEMYHEMMMITNNNNNNGGGGGGALNEDGSSSGEGGGGGGGGGGTHLKKGPWTATEDAILTEYVKRHGEGNWNAVQRNSGLARCGKSCRLRWANHLRPNLKKGSFSPEEERLIVQLHAKYGNKWARMAAQLPGRTDNEIKNYWNTRIKRRHRQGLPLYPPDVKPEHPQAKQQSQRNQHHQQQQQQQQQQQSPQQSQPTTPFSSTPTTPFSSTPTTPLSSTPTTPTSSFSFQTQLLSPTPATPPPSLSPTPSPNSTFPTLPLFDPFSLPRTPPLLTNSIRFKRHHLDTITNNNTTTSLPFPSECSNLFTHEANASCPLSRLPSFQLSPMPMVPDQSVYSVKLELPSSQFASQTGNSDITFDTKMNGSNGLLEDLLEEAHTLANGTESFKRPNCLSFQEDNRVFNGFDSRWGYSSSSMSLSSGFESKADAADQQNDNMHEDLSKFFNVIPSTMQEHEWYNDSRELSNGHSSVVTDDNLGLDMQHIASLFPVGTSTDRGKTPSSCSWDNLPGIC